MIYPIVAYGDPVLRKKSEKITKDYPKLSELIDNMFLTMYKSSGVGLAAPQIGLAIRLFIIDAAPFKDDNPEVENFKKIFINAQILEEEGKKWKFNEGCLSIPGIREDIDRKPTITIQYQDENFVTHTETYDGVKARIIQHEYDHIEGVLFVDYLTPLKKQLVKGRLSTISKGIVDVDYRMKFFKK
jgi:peptide deformylase